MIDLSNARWFKSSRSHATGSCVEVATNLIGASWRKSTRSNGAGGNCVEVAGNLPGVVAVRDSKDPHGPALTVHPAGWAAFAHAVAAGTVPH